MRKKKLLQHGEICGAKAFLLALIKIPEKVPAVKVQILAVMGNQEVGPPCGACREFLMQLDETSGEIEVLMDRKTKKTLRLRELVPDWWGKDR